ncbi:hypothetical protein QZH41_020533, partial [Actinostola sp. cb2023]
SNSPDRLSLGVDQNRKQEVHFSTISVRNMAGNAAMPSGYDYEFVVKVPDEYICTICHLPMRKPVQTKCGHRFCKACLKESNKRNRECPVDRKPIGRKPFSKIFEDKATERTILLLKIKCPNNGCAWQGELGNLQDHQKHCEYQIVDCDNMLQCNVKKPRHQMVIHVMRARMSVQDGPVSSLQGNEHTNVCPKCPVSCPNRCGETLPREKVTSHESTECPLTIVPCSYESFGCNFKIFEDKATERTILQLNIKCPIDGCTWQGELGNLQDHQKHCEYQIVDCDNKLCKVKKPRHQMVIHVQQECQYRMVQCHCKDVYKFYDLQGERRDLNDHVMNSMSQHLTITTQQLLSLKTQMDNMETRIRNQFETRIRNQMDNMESRIRNQCETRIRNQMDNMETRIRNQCETRIRNQMDNMETRIRNQCETRIRNQMDNMEIRIRNQCETRIRNQMDNMETRIRNQCETRIRNPSYFSFIWKVEDFSQQLQNAKQEDRNIELFSEPFYTHKYGHKLKLELDPNGHGKDKGTHASVFLIVMRSEYDAILTWPFDWKIKFIILDQKPDNSLRKNIEHGLTPDRTDSIDLKCFKRPTTDENQGLGFGTFVSHETLATENYVVDGTLFLQLELEKP